MTAGAPSVYAEGLPHPEGVAFDAAGWLYTGTAEPDTGRGPIHRIAPGGTRVEVFADTGGRALGLAFDADGYLYACDATLSAVVRISPEGLTEVFADAADGRALMVPNFAVFDDEGRLYVSDSGTATAGERTGAVYRFDPDGIGVLLVDGLIFANGMALSDDGASLYVVETRDDRVMHIPLRGPGAGVSTVFAAGLTSGPDGLAFDSNGNLLVTLTRTDTIVSVSPDARRERVSDGGLLRAPSNMAFDQGGDAVIYVANVLGRHITRLPVSHPGAALRVPQVVAGTAPVHPPADRNLERSAGDR